MMEIKMQPIRKLKPYRKNAKIHTPEQVERIANSIREFKFKQPLVITEGGVIIIGHGRFEAAKKLGLDEVPCVVADDLTDEQIKALRLADNKVAESEWDVSLLDEELSDILDIDMEQFGFLDFEDAEDEPEPESDLDPSCQHNVFENQERMQFEGVGFYGIPEMSVTHTVGDKMLRFMDHNTVDDLGDYIACFYYDDYKFISAWRDPDKYIDKLREFKAVVSPDFSLYTDFPRALQILSCYRRQWCGAYWQALGIDVIPDVVWGDRDSFEYCFDGIPKGGTVAVSTVGVKNDKSWNNAEGNMFLDGYNEMLKRLHPGTILFYGDMIDGCEGNIIQIPSYYAQRREEWGKK